MSRPILLTVLFVSLALNVFVAGAFVGAKLNRGPPDGGGQELRPRNPVAAAVAVLPPDAQAAWREQMPEFARTYGPKVRQARRLMRQTMLGFGDEPFDADAALADLRKARDLEAESRTEMDRRIVTFAAGLPRPERRRFGEALARPAGPKHGKAQAAAAP